MYNNNFSPKRKAKAFNYGDVVQPNTTLEIIQNEQEHDERFNRMLKETKQKNKRENKERLMISKRPVVKQRLVHLYVSGYYSTKQIANILCVSPNTVRKWLKDVEIKDMIRMYQDEEKDIVDTALKSLRMRAIETQAELLESDNDNVRADISKDILNRTGHGATNKTDVNINISYEERLAKLAENAVISDTDSSVINNTDYTVINDESTKISTEGDD